VRPWEGELVDPGDKKESEITHYLLSNNTLGLLVNCLITLISSPGKFLKALKLVIKLSVNAKGNIIKHTAYFLQGCYLFQKIKDQDVQHIHVHFSTNSTTVAMLCRALGGPSYSFTAHGPDEFDAPYHSSMAEKIEHAAFVIAITNFCKSQLIRYSNFSHWNKIHVLHCGIPTDDFKGTDVSFDENYQLVMIARMSVLKGQLLLPDVVAPLTQKYPKLKVVLVGDGEIRTELEKKIQDLDLENHFDLVGWKSNSEVRLIIQSSRGLVLPSFAEGLPIVFMEALAMERPVIATYIAGIPELIDEACGWVVPAGSLDSLTDAIDKLLSASSEEIKSMGEEGRRRVLAEHDVGNLAIKFKDIFSRYIQVN
jgi:glycosyltransferase involved in cell wall biosynthesis